MVSSPRPGYSTREVARLLEINEAQVRSWVRSGFLEPRRGLRNQLLFDFQDLVLLRTAQALIAAALPTRRVRRALERLRDQLPRGRSLSSVRIAAEGNHVVVHLDEQSWEPLSGQRMLDFEVAELAQKAEPLAMRTAERARDRADELAADDWYDLGFELEATTIAEAKAAYQRTLSLDPEHVGARLNLGRLHHEEGELAEAERHYRIALENHSGEDATAAFNLGVALQDLGRDRAAIEAYRLALQADWNYADAHFNLAGLYEKLGKKAEAIRSLQAYKHSKDRQD